MQFVTTPRTWNQQRPAAPPPEDPRRSRWPRWVILTALAGMSLIVLAAVLVGPQVLNRRSCAAWVSGVCLSRTERNLLEAQGDWLGTVVGRAAVEGHSYLFFTYAAVRHDPRPEVRGTAAEWPLLDLGRRHALRHGLELQPDAPAHPIVRAWLDEQTRASVPWRERLGPFPITPVFCAASPRVGGTAACIQDFTYAVLRFDPSSQHVTRDRVGEEAFLWYAGARASDK